MDQIIYVGIGVFVLVLILTLSYQGYATTANQMQGIYCKAGSTWTTCTGANDLGSGAFANFTKYGGTLPNTFGGALQLAVFALVFIAIILAIVGALRGSGATGGTSGGFLS